MALELTTLGEGEAVRTVVPTGDVDVSCAAQLRDAIDSVLVEGTTEVVVALAEVPYIDSTGIGVLVGAAHRALDAGMRLRVTNPQRNVARVFGLLGIDRELGTIEAAE